MSNDRFWLAVYCCIIASPGSTPINTQGVIILTHGLIQEDGVLLLPNGILKSVEITPTWATPGCKPSTPKERTDRAITSTYIVTWLAGHTIVPLQRAEGGLDKPIEQSKEDPDQWMNRCVVWISRKPQLVDIAWPYRRQAAMKVTDRTRLGAVFPYSNNATLTSPSLKVITDLPWLDWWQLCSRELVWTITMLDQSSSLEWEDERTRKGSVTSVSGTRTEHRCFYTDDPSSPEISERGHSITTPTTPL